MFNHESDELDIDEKNLSVIFGTLDDPRIERKKLYPLREIFFLALASVLAGADSWRSMESFGEARFKWLQQFMPFENGIPSHQTIGRVFSLFKPSTLEVAFIQFMAEITKKSPENIIALDGKTLRRSFDKASNTKPIHILNACAIESGLCLAQLVVDEKTNEITAVPDIIDFLKSSGAIFTMDALNTQKSILEKVIKTGNDCVMPAKENQKTLQTEISSVFQIQNIKKEATKVDIEKGHGRIDTRSYKTLSAEGLNLEKDWPGVKSIGMATTESIRGDKTTSETRFFIMTFPPNVELFAKCVRGHWAVENKLHWVLDVTFGEDASRVRKDHAPRNMSLIRKLAINLLREDKNPKKGLANQKRWAAFNMDYHAEILRANGF